jgi:hypothetical protein
MLFRRWRIGNDERCGEPRGFRLLPRARFQRLGDMQMSSIFFHFLRLIEEKTFEKDRVSKLFALKLPFF